MAAVESIPAPDVSAEEISDKPVTMIDTHTPKEANHYPKSFAQPKGQKRSEQMTAETRAVKKRGAH